MAGLCLQPRLCLASCISEPTAGTWEPSADCLTVSEWSGVTLQQVRFRSDRHASCQVPEKLRQLWGGGYGSYRVRLSWGWGWGEGLTPWLQQSSQERVCFCYHTCHRGTVSPAHWPCRAFANVPSFRILKMEDATVHMTPMNLKTKC